MKKIVRFKFIPLMILALFFLARCEKKSDLPTDGDGNVYDTVVIGTQVWLTENLKTTKYNNGTEIRLVTDNTEWSELALPAYCWYNNEPSTYKDYGALYNWYAAKLELLCPVGWHTPTEDEWTTMINYLGGEYMAGGKLKETGFTHWNVPNEGATNETGFTALPGGRRSAIDGTFGAIRDVGSWWVSDISHKINVKYQSEFTSIGGLSPQTGFSVRCVKDN